MDWVNVQTAADKFKTVKETELKRSKLKKNHLHIFPVILLILLSFIRTLYAAICLYKMGTSGSKLAAKLPSETPEEKGSVPTTPILTRNCIQEVPSYDLDPRSPSRNISRTPIELLTEAAAKLKKFQTEVEDVVDAATPVRQKILLEFDPRSPTIDFTRTPIVISTSPDSQIPNKLHNKLFDNVRKSNMLGTPKVTSRRGIPPKLLESSPITPKSNDVNKRKSFVGLLETNIDYTETNLDTVIREKGLNLSNSMSNDDFIGVINDDPRSPTTDFLRTPIQVLKKYDDESVVVEKSKDISEEEKNELEILVNLDGVKSPLTLEVKLEIAECQTGVQVDENESSHVLVPEEDAVISEVKETLNVTPENEQMQLKTSQSTPITPIQNTVEVTPKQTKSEPVSPPTIDLTADIKELDKKLTNLIYEDESDLVVCPRIVKLKEQNRTPLGDKNHKVANQPKLTVSDKPRKSEYAVSKIPLYREKSKNKHSKKVQCENTPPRSMMVRSKNKSHWDNDNTLVI